MGGVMIVLALDVTVLLWAKWNEFLALSLMSVVVLAALGFYDDWVKLTKQDKAGIHSKVMYWNTRRKESQSAQATWPFSANHCGIWLR